MDQADVNEIYKDLNELKNKIANVGKISDVMEYLHVIEDKITKLQEDVNSIKRDIPI